MSRSLGISERQSRRSSAQKENKEESKSYSYADFCREHFRFPSTSSQFSVKELKHPLLKHTPDEDTAVVIKIWRTVIRFMSNDAATQAGNVDSVRSQSRGRTRRGSYSSTKPTTVAASVAFRLSQEASGVEPDVTRAEEKQTDSGSHPQSGTWNTFRLRQLTSKLRQNLRISEMDQQDGTSTLEGSLTSGFEQMQYIVGWGLVRPTLRDEVFAILLRQLTNNPQKAWRFRGWVLFSLTVGAFLPSEKIMLYVTKFIDTGPSSFSSSLKKLFVRVITNGPRHQPPSYQEYQAAIGGKCLTVLVTLMDGTSHSVEADSATTSSEVISSISRAIDLRETFGFSLFVAMTNKVSSLGNEGDKVMDTVSHCEQLFRNQHSLPEADTPWRLFLRKEMFSPWDDVSMDSVASSLIFAQICRGVVLGEYVCDTDAELDVLAAKQYYCEFENEVSEEGLTGIIAGYLPPNKLGDQKKRQLWCRRVARCYRKLFNVTDGNMDAAGPSVEEVKAEVINWAKTKWLTSFCRYFDVIRFDSPDDNSDSLTLALNLSGMSLLTTKGRRVLDVQYSQLLSVTGEGQDPELRSISGSVVVVTLADGTTVKLKSIDSNEIYQAITHCVRGLRERSTWAIAKRNYDGTSVGHLTVSEGDLLRLESAAKEEAMTSSTARCTNTDDPQRTGILPTQLLLILATLKEPTEDILRAFRPSSYSVTKSDDDLRKGGDINKRIDDASTKATTPFGQNDKDNSTNGNSGSTSPVVVLERRVVDTDSRSSSA